MSTRKELLKNRLDKVQALIEQHLDAQLSDSSSSSGLKSSSLNDGQTTVRTELQDIDKIGSAYNSLLQQEQSLIQQLYGFGIYLIPAKKIY